MTQKSYTQKDLLNDYNNDQRKAKQEGGILALVILFFAVIGIVSLFSTRTDAQPQGQLASGVSECVQLCTTQ